MEHDPSSALLHHPSWTRASTLRPTEAIARCRIKGVYIGKTTTMTAQRVIGGQVIPLGALKFLSHVGLWDF